MGLMEGWSVFCVSLFHSFVLRGNWAGIRDCPCLNIYNISIETLTFHTLLPRSMQFPRAVRAAPCLCLDTGSLVRFATCLYDFIITNFCRDVRLDSYKCSCQCAVCLTKNGGSGIL